MRAVLAIVIIVIAGLWTPSARAAADPICGAVDALYPQPGRDGAGKPNSFRPLPQLLPERAAPGAPGRLSLSMTVFHVGGTSPAIPQWVYIGNYRVTDLPAMKVTPGGGTRAVLPSPVGGAPVAMPLACLTNQDWGYAGTQWSLYQGDSTDTLFQSRLDYSSPGAVQLPVNGGVPCRASNLHTHGLLVSPYHPAKPGRGPYGDYVLDVTQPHGAKDSGGRDDCGTDLGMVAHQGHGLTDLPLRYQTTIPGTPHVSSLETGEHPSGLFWYHPHPHGFSRQQVSGGTTGVITVGDLTDYACPLGQGTPGNCTIANTNVRVLSLKDTEILPLSGGLWSVVHDDSETVHDYDPSFCNPTGPDRLGECPAADGSNGKWVFTINGVEFPHMNPAAGQGEIWRIVNASPNVNYHLRLVAAGHTADSAALPFQVLATDGVSVRQAAGVADMRQDILVMPATRVEIYIPAPPAGGRYILENEAVTTGANGGGDTWPAVNLAEIEWPLTPLASRATPALVVAGAGTPHTSAVSVSSAGVPANCVFQPGDTRKIYFVHRTNQLGNEVFGLIAGVQHEGGSMDFFNSAHPERTLHSVQDVWQQGVASQDASFPGYMHNDYNAVCTVKGNVEPWELQNWTSENHNFHIHQSKFSVNLKGNFQFPLREPHEPVSLTSADATLRAFLDQSMPSYHDTVPVPRGQSFCSVDASLPGCKPTDPDDNLECTGEPEAARCAHPGKMSVLLDFSRNEQVGSFVYHCHILEHEDGGMMANVRVLCPPGDASCAAVQAAENICRPQETN